MIVAGSVLAMLLMGLAVEGLVMSNNDDDTDTDETGDTEQETGSGEEAVESTLSDLLAAVEQDTDDGNVVDDFAASSAALGYTPLDDMDMDDDAPEVMISSNDPTPEAASEVEDPAEQRADADWSSASTVAGDQHYLEMDNLTSLNDQTEVIFVTSFDTSADELVLEFDGTQNDTPEIEVDHTREDGAAVVLANGIPVALMENAPELSIEQIRVVMSEGALADDPQVQPNDPDIPTKTDSDLLERQVIPTDYDVLSNDGGDPAAPVPTDLEEFETVVEQPDDGLPTQTAMARLIDSIIAQNGGIGAATDALDARSAIAPAFGTGGTDAITGTFNDDMLHGGSGQDAIFGDEGGDHLSAGAGNDELYGDTGDDHLEGEDGFDFLDGGEGADTLDGGGDRDLLFGGDGDDVLHGGAADDFLSGGYGSDTLNGGSGNDVLNGTFSSGGTDEDAGDLLWGGSGDDTIIIGQDDLAHGGAGSDTFIGGSNIEDPGVEGHVADFDSAQDRIEVIFDPDINPNPTVEVHDFADGTGADIILNGEVILSVTGAQGLDPNLIDLREMA